MIRPARPVLAVLAAVLASVALGVTPAAATSGASLAADTTTVPANTVPTSAMPPTWLGQCTTTRLPAALPDATAATLTGLLCTPRRSRPGTVLLEIHGATYNSAYWNWPLDPARQSFTWSALAAGYATFALDKLGAGRSSAPPSTSVTFTAQAEAIHQTIGALRTGALGTRFARVVLVAHSFGSAEADAELAAHGDADALVATGSGHATSTAISQDSTTMFAPAVALLPARFAGRDPGYRTTTTLAARRAVLYNQDTPTSVVAFDQATRDAVSATEMATRPPDLSALTRAIRVPVLLIDGSLDSHYCAGVTGQTTGLDDCTSPAGLYASERGNYTGCFAAATVPGSGHDLTTEPESATAAVTILGWLAATVPAGGPPARCAITGPWPTPRTPAPLG
jgi:alpha-beta hydrolase superfamily lysophospholipase